jgi:parvulin-like peptidyl-prolyl isomerase
LQTAGDAFRLEHKLLRAIRPIQTKLGYHILKVEKWFPAELSKVREQVLESLYQAWLQAGSNSDPRTEQHQ